MGASSMSWSPDGERLAFNSARSGNAEVYTMSADGSDVKQITFNSANDTGPIWSPDGKQIAFTSDRDGNAEVYVMRSNGAHEVRLTNNDAFDATVSWQPIPKPGKH